MAPRASRRSSTADFAARTAELQASALRQTRRGHASEVAEDYVEAVADLTASVGEARAVDLARRLGVTHVTVIRTVARLKRQGYLSSQPYRSIFLTEKGLRLAAQARQRHKLVVSLLRALGVPEEVAQNDAEGIEHHVSPETLAAIRHFLDSRSHG
jgi:DtxR family manganese transport transcriptional regulator